MFCKINYWWCRLWRVSLFIFSNFCVILLLLLYYIVVVCIYQSIKYCQYLIVVTFLVWVKVLPILLKKVSIEVLPIFFWQKISISFINTFFYHIGFNSLLQSAAVKCLYSLAEKIFTLLHIRLSSKIFDIMMFFMCQMVNLLFKLES